MSNKKNLFSSLATFTAGAVVGTALAFSPVIASANDHEEDKHECKCSGDKKAECEKDHGEHSCSGEASCSGNK